MSYWNLGIESSQGSGSGCCRVTVYKNNIRMTLLENITKTGKDSRCYIS